MLIAHASSKRLACWFGKLSLYKKARHGKRLVQGVVASSRNVRLQSQERQRDRSKRSRRSSSGSGSATDGSSSDSDSGDAKSGEDEAEACFQGVCLMFSRAVIQRSILICFMKHQRIACMKLNGGVEQQFLSFAQRSASALSWSLSKHQTLVSQTAGFAG
jgi:hypothetical protein